MTTRHDKATMTGDFIRSGYEGFDTPDDFTIPPCTIEDVDRAVFHLFDKKIPFQYKRREEVKSVPVIFATGERFAVLRRKRPLRDKNNALILPLVSILRSGVTQDSNPGMGPGQGGPQMIKKRISKESDVYQRLMNTHGLVNQDSVAAVGHRVATGPVTGSLPGTVAKREGNTQQSLSSRRGHLLTPSLGSDVYEILTMPPVKYYTVTYDVTFWAQYTQEMNDMLMTMMSVYQDNRRRTFKLVTDKGYWFVAYVGADLSPGNNYDDFTDSERLVRYNFEVRVTAYLIAPDYSGAPAPIRRFISAPSVSFETTQVAGPTVGIPISTPPSGDPSAYILDDLATTDDPNPGQGMGTDSSQAAVSLAGGRLAGSAPSAQEGSVVGSKVSVQRGLTASEKASGANLGGFNSGPAGVNLVRSEKDPFTGKQRKTIIRIKSRNQRKGETVYREGINIDLGKL